ncbi:carboxypeptidase-like regulatory domain-containing protein [Humisphaera borealis]|uniref:Carboxypeptidase regulatory-like domain-containing protein n=1 Tax=Humisphaera borealis TaxID=2807512 RepID=A0A7M2WZX3_9BACT|nr:carboxypeptidase-like regulatory domain-containing protein [Humisphaera borealis]QOV90030.1 carboxypeptidase regulatory-like domain-containing protein [Humisphaera borealis]
MYLVKKLSMSVLALAFMASVSLAGEITGTVTGKDGKPAASVAVKLMKGGAGKKPAAAPAAGEKKPGAAALKETSTDDKGAFKFDGVEDGEYRVQAGSKEAGTGGAAVKVAGGKADPVSITLKEAKPKAK